MEKQEITQLLDNKNQELHAFLEQQPVDKWEKGPEGKWTTGQHILHLLQSAKQLNKALGYPKFLLRYKFGKSNRSPREYNAIVARYNERLEGAKGRTFGPSKNMRTPSKNEKPELLKQLKEQEHILRKKTQKWKDKHLDNLLLPHPLMGKMPIREIIMWSAYHVAHHTKTLKGHYN